MAKESAQPMVEHGITIPVQQGRETKNPRTPEIVVVRPRTKAQRDVWIALEVMIWSSLLDSR